MVQITINDKEYKLPTSFEEITLEDYIRVFNGLQKTDELEGIEKYKAIRENEAKILSRLLNEDDDFAINLPLPIYAQLNEAVQFIYSLQTLSHHNKINVDGETYFIPKPEEFNLRQWIDVDVVLDDKDDAKYIDLLCILLCKRDKDGKLVAYKGMNEGLKDKVRKMKASDALGIVYHFFLLGGIFQMITSTSSAVEEIQSLLAQSTISS